MTTTMTILSNSFHNTKARTLKTRDELDAIRDRIDQGWATDADKALARRLRRSLCGVSDCQCGDWLGER